MSSTGAVFEVKVMVDTLVKEEVAVGEVKWVRSSSPIGQKIP